MTYAPGKLLELRGYLKPLTWLSDNALGITSDGYGHGYHRGRDSISFANDYSVTESARDRDGLTNAASAIDIGLFDRTTSGQRRTLRSLSLWLVEQCKAGATDTRDIREIIYTPDGQVVRRWDRLGRRTSGDDSHLTHTHISWFRDSEYRDKIAVFRRYFEEEDMAGIEDVLREVAELRRMLQQHHLQNQGDHTRGGSMAGVAYGVKQVQAELNQIENKLAEHETAEAARDTELKNLLAAHSDGTLSAEEVVRRIGELLSA
ncbi:MAG: hypothetical protein ACREQA_19725 [Candidatus Binatia bacterium]